MVNAVLFALGAELLENSGRNPVCISVNGEHGKDAIWGSKACSHSTVPDALAEVKLQGLGRNRRGHEKCAVRLAAGSPKDIVVGEGVAHGRKRVGAGKLLHCNHLQDTALDPTHRRMGTCARLCRVRNLAPQLVDDEVVRGSRQRAHDCTVKIDGLLLHGHREDEQVEVHLWKGLGTQRAAVRTALRTLAFACSSSSGAT